MKSKNRLDAEQGLKIGSSSTAGYVWTATDAAGNGSWQASGGGGSGLAYATTIGNGSATSFTLTHGLGTSDVIVAVREVATPFRMVDTTIAAISTTQVTITFINAPATNAYRVTVLAGGGTFTGAPLDSPAFTGTPTAPTAGANTNTTQLATTAFVQQEIASDLVAYAPHKTVRKTADQANATTTLTNVTDLALPVTIGADHTFEFIVAYTSATATVGVGFAVTCPSLNAAGFIGYTIEIIRSAETAIGTAPAIGNVQQIGSGTSSGDAVGSEATPTTNTAYIAFVKGICSDPSASGNIQLQHRSETATTTTVKKGSWGRMYVN